MGDFDIGNILKFIFIGVVILAWIGGQVVRVFLRPDEQQRRRFPRPDRPLPGRPNAPPRQQPADMGGFLEELRRQSEEQKRAFRGMVEEEDKEEFEEEPLFWEPVGAEPPRAPPRPLTELAKLEAVVARRISAPPTAGVSEETRVSDPAVSNLYAAPAHFSPPSWLSVSDITQAKHMGTILGVTPQRALLLTEIIGPPLSMRRRPGGRYSL